jgi:hypothetical protein
MVDYYSIIAREVAALDMSTGAARRALYDRARVELLDLLRGVTPALDESQITRERISLEAAVRKVEWQLARESRARSETTRVKAPTLPPWEEPAADPAKSNPVQELARLVGQPHF